MKRRIRVVATILVLITLLLTGCSSPKPESTSPKVEETKITEVLPAPPKVEDKQVLSSAQTTSSPLITSQPTDPIKSETPSQITPNQNTTSSNPEPKVTESPSLVAGAIVAGAVATTQTNSTIEPTPTTKPVIDQSDKDVLVWIPIHGGTKYHSKSSCSNMIDPIQVPLSEAISKGFEPCKRCH